jgi:hypothetical protein
MGLLRIIGSVIALPLTIVSGAVSILCDNSTNPTSNCDATQAVETVAEASRQSSETKKRARED